MPTQKDLLEQCDNALTEAQNLREALREIARALFNESLPTLPLSGHRCMELWRLARAALSSSPSGQVLVPADAIERVRELLEDIEMGMAPHTTLRLAREALAVLPARERAGEPPAGETP